MGNSDIDPDRLSVQEVRQVLDQMDGAQWKRAERLARFAVQGLAGMDADDLLVEVCTRLLSGHRRFPRGKPPLVVLKTAMRSEVSNFRKSAWAKRLDSKWLTEPGPSCEDSNESDDSGTLAPGAINEITPEKEMISKEFFDAVMTSVEGDTDAELVLIAWAEGARGVEAMSATGLDAKPYDAARNRLLRKFTLLAVEDRRS